MRIALQPFALRLRQHRQAQALHRWPQLRQIGRDFAVHFCKHAAAAPQLGNLGGRLKSLLRIIAARQQHHLAIELRFGRLIRRLPHRIGRLLGRQKRAEVGLQPRVRSQRVCQKHGGNGDKKRVKKAGFVAHDGFKVFRRPIGFMGFCCIGKAQYPTQCFFSDGLRPLQNQI